MEEKVEVETWVDAEGLHIKRMVNINEETLRLLTQDDGFADYLRKLIQEEFDRRMEKALRALATGEKENAKVD